MATFTVDLTGSFVSGPAASDTFDIAASTSRCAVPGLGGDDVFNIGNTTAGYCLDGGAGNDWVGVNGNGHRLSGDERLQITTARVMGLLQIIDRLDSGVILADALARPLLVNDRAARIAREADGLLLRNAIAAATPEATRRLREAVAATASDTACESPRLGLERPSGRPPLLLTLMPIWRLGTQVLGGAGAPRVAIFIKETDAPLVIDRRLLADSLRLTQRESEVAALLADGLDLAEVAGRLGQGIGTARSHLKRVFDKTGARSQAALVALVRGFGDPGPSPPDRPPRRRT